MRAIEDRFRETVFQQAVIPLLLLAIIMIFYLLAQQSHRIEALETGSICSRVGAGVRQNAV